MIHKQHIITMPKPWPHLGSLGLHIQELIARVSKAMEVPTGYQDDTGFHLGEEPAQKEVKWPPVW